MEFEEGLRAMLKPKDVAQLISRVFHSQTFLARCLGALRSSSCQCALAETGKPQMVLVDHGLYKQLDDDLGTVEGSHDGGYTDRQSKNQLCNCTHFYRAC